MIKIFDIQSDRVVVNENVLLIPELKAVYEAYGIPGLTFVHYTTHPDSPYINHQEDSKYESLYKKYPGKYNPDDVEITDAIEELNKFYKTPKYHFWEGLKTKLEEFTYMMKNVPLDIDKDTGNFNENIRLFEKIDKLFMAYEKAEKAKDEELATRGNQKQSYDQY